jgi:hypothetical protein
MTYTRDSLVELRDRVKRMTVEERDALADRLIEAGAGGEVFEWMHRGGWRPRSQREPDGIEGGTLDEVPPALRRSRKGQHRGR